MCTTMVWGHQIAIDTLCIYVYRSSPFCKRTNAWWAGMQVKIKRFAEKNGLNCTEQRKRTPFLRSFLILFTRLASFWKKTTVYDAFAARVLNVHQQLRFANLFAVHKIQSSCVCKTNVDQIRFKFHDLGGHSFLFNAGLLRDLHVDNWGTSRC